MLVRSLCLYPCNWSAWQALQALVSGRASSSASASASASAAASAAAAAAASGSAGDGATAGGSVAGAAGVVGLGLAGLAALPLPPHWARDFFLASLSLELHHNQEALSKLHGLAQVQACTWQWPWLFDRDHECTVASAMKSLL